MALSASSQKTTSLQLNRLKVTDSFYLGGVWYRNLNNTPDTGKLSQNLTVNLGTGVTLGGVGTGSYFPKGVEIENVLRAMLIKAVAPTYTTPSASITLSPAVNSYEYGTNVGKITFTSSFSQSDAGALTATAYYANASPLSADTFRISSLTTSNQFYVRKTYNQGACKVNNLGDTNCTGRITAGSVNSGTVTISPFYKRYYGWLSDTTGITTGGQNANILALAQGASSSQSLTVNTGNPGGTKFYVFGYISSSPNISSITQNGNPSIAAWNFATISNFTNNQGAGISIKIVYSKNGQTGSSDIIFN